MIRLPSVVLVLGLSARAAVAGNAPPPAAAPLPARSLAVTRPSAEELERAFTRRDAVELERLGARLGGVRLVALVERGSRGARLAALGALELTAGSLVFLPRLVAIAGAEPDPALALAVMETARRIVERVPRGEVDLDELPGDLPRAAVDALGTLAGRDDRPALLRVASIAALAALASLEASQKLAIARLASLSTSKEVTVRRAVADGLPTSASLVLGRILAEDGVNEVALAAAVSLCRELPPVGAERKGDGALLRAAELSAAARARLRLLVQDASLPEADRADAIPCLRAGAQRAAEQRADADVLRAIGRGPEGPMRRRARAYGGR